MKKVCTYCGLKKEEDVDFYATKRDGPIAICKECSNERAGLYHKLHPEGNRLAQKKYREKNPWHSHFHIAKQRCSDSKHKSYKNYGARGIKFLLSKEEVKRLWYRDEAYLMNRPSIDRIDEKGDYVYSNCRFMEWREHLKRQSRGYHGRFVRR